MLHKKTRNYPVISKSYVIMYDYKFHSGAGIYLMVVNWSWRHIRRYLCVCYSLLFLLIFFFNFQMCKWQSNVQNDDRNDRPIFCDQAIIRKHFMHDQRPQDLLAQNASRSAFTYELSNSNFCSSVAPHALIFVISKSTNLGSRNAIRRTWGDFTHITSVKKYAHLRLKLLFLIDIDEVHLLNINLEQSLYNDLVQVRLPQHYTLSTYRDMAILDWTENYCSQALMTIKTDDDIFLNTYLLANVLTNIMVNMTVPQTKSTCQSLENLDSPAVIYGVRFRGAEVVRASNDPSIEGARYIITDDEYPCTYYPDYMSGFGYIINRNARVKLLCAFFRHEKSFHMSDVYVTGILPEYMNIQRQHLRFQISYQSTDDCDSFFDANNAYACASPSHYKQKHSSLLTDIYIFERFNSYWKRIYHNRLLYINRYLLFG